MHARLQSFLDDVWKNADNILFADPDPGKAPQAKLKGTTVGQRVYSLYALGEGAPAIQVMSKEFYNNKLERIRKPANSSWRPQERQNGFFFWRNFAGQGSADYRVYLNPKPVCAADVFQRILDCSAKALDVNLDDPFDEDDVPRERHSRNIPADKKVLDRHLGEVIVTAKIALAEDAFMGRRDVIVVYVNGGRTIAAAFARKAVTWAYQFNDSTVPMTDPIAAGISIGAEVHGNLHDRTGQWKVGVSFGHVRCNLIARALVEAVTGLPVSTIYPMDELTVPLPPATALKGNTSEATWVKFRLLVTLLFDRYNINANAPWD